MASRQQRRVDAWRTSIVTALEDKASRKARGHKLVKFLMSDFVEAINELEAKKPNWKARSRLRHRPS